MHASLSCSLPLSSNWPMCHAIHGPWAGGRVARREIPLARAYPESHRHSIFADPGTHAAWAVYRATLGCFALAPLDGAFGPCIALVMVCSRGDKPNKNSPTYAALESTVDWLAVTGTAPTPHSVLA